MAERPSALDGFLGLDCDEDLASTLRAEVELARSAGRGYRQLGGNLFDVEFFFAEDRVVIVDASLDQYEDVTVTVDEFLTALGPGPVGEPFPDPPRRVIIPPAPEA